MFEQEKPGAGIKVDIDYDKMELKTDDIVITNLQINYAEQGLLIMG